MSSTSAEATTSSWEETVDMIAARTAVRIRPAISGWKTTLAMSRKFVS